MSLPYFALHSSNPSAAITVMLDLHQQGRNTMDRLLKESCPEGRFQLYQKLHQINDALCIPTDSMEVLGVRAPALEGGAA